MTRNHEDSALLDRRAFLKKMAIVISGGTALGTLGLTPSFATGFPEKSSNPSPAKSASLNLKPDRKLIYVAIDALHPKYLELDTADSPGGRDGTSDTLFHAWKRRWPGSKTFMISGKEWVAEMFRESGAASGVDMIVTGSSRPSYLPPPKREPFADPFSDSDGRCDPESGNLGLWDREALKAEGWRNHFRPSQVMNRLYCGQHSLLTLQMERFPSHFPHDSWIVDSALSVFKNEKPDMAYILLAQCDDGGHCIGSGWDVSEFVAAPSPPIYPANCAENPEYLLVSKRNPLIYREAALDVIRDVDIQFGRLMQGLDDQGILDTAAVILLSDHSAENHIYTRDFMSTDIMGVLQKHRLAAGDDIYAFSVSSYGVLYFRDDKGKVPEAAAALKNHKALNPQTGGNALGG